LRSRPSEPMEERSRLRDRLAETDADDDRRQEKV
jgi:hypothetical protein